MATTHLVLTVDLHVPNDPEPGGPSRISSVLPKIKTELSRGNMAGEFTERFEYSQGGSPESDIATVRWKIERIETAERTTRRLRHMTLDGRPSRLDDDRSHR